jgi:hypothetical protein
MPRAQASPMPEEQPVIRMLRWLNSHLRAGGGR